MIEQRTLRGNVCPVLVCDQCKRIILSARDALVVWPCDAPTRIRIVHIGGRCDRDRKACSAEADVWLYRLLRNSGYEPRDVMARATLAEGL